MFHIYSFSSVSSFSGHSIMEDGSGILHSSPRSYFLLGSVIFAKDFNVFWEGGQNCRF